MNTKKNEKLHPNILWGRPHLRGGKRVSNGGEYVGRKGVLFSCKLTSFAEKFSEFYANSCLSKRGGELKSHSIIY